MLYWYSIYRRTFGPVLCKELSRRLLRVQIIQWLHFPLLKGRIIILHTVTTVTQEQNRMESPLVSITTPDRRWRHLIEMNILLHHQYLPPVTYINPRILWYTIQGRHIRSPVSITIRYIIHSLIIICNITITHRLLFKWGRLTYLVRLLQVSTRKILEVKQRMKKWMVPHQWLARGSPGTKHPIQIKVFLCLRWHRSHVLPLEKTHQPKVDLEILHLRIIQCGEEEKRQLL